MKRYFVVYDPDIKASYCVDASSKETMSFMISIMNRDNFWTEVGWFDFWFYRLFF